MTTNKVRLRSEELYERALKILPGGVSRNTALRRPQPGYALEGKGCRVMDVDGVERIDFANNMASLIHGHSHPKIVEAVTEQLRKGTAFTMATEAELLFAEHICSRSRIFDMVRFVNSGTEAVMSCLKASRAFTGRPAIAKVEGAYHGLYDYAEVSQNSNPSNWGPVDAPSSVPVAHGTPDSALKDVVVIPFNNIDRALAILDARKDEIACVLVDLLPHRVGLIPADDAYLTALREWTIRNDALLVFDEVVTFRSCYGGAHQDYTIRPDLVALGKMIGGGFPVGALTGRKDVMEVMNPLKKRILFPHSGTFSANPITMTAGRVAMELYDAEAVDCVNDLAVRARKQIEEAIALVDLPACVTGGGSLFRVHLKEKAPTEYRGAYADADELERLRILLDFLWEHGFMMINTCSFALSTAITGKEVDLLSETMLNGLRKVKELS